MCKICGFTSSCTCAKSHPGICSPMKYSIAQGIALCPKVGIISQIVDLWAVLIIGYIFHTFSTKQPSRHMTSIQRRLNVDATSWRCIDVETTLYKRRVPAGNLPGTCVLYYPVYSVCGQRRPGCAIWSGSSLSAQARTQVFARRSPIIYVWITVLLSSLRGLPRLNEKESLVFVFNTKHQYNLRNSGDIQTIRAKTNQFYNSFLPSTLREWNNLPSEARQCTTLNSFKHFLKKDKSSVPNYYYHGNRKAQILHARLRTGCSSLNLDLFYKNITDSPLCLCGSVEDPQHFFFHCRFYQAHRNILLNAITGYYTPSLRLLLYGDPSLSQEINRDIFDHVHKFIIDTKRF